VKRLQAKRLAHTYADLSAQPRYRAATRFFLVDLYGEKDFSARDREMLKIVPVMSRVLPATAVETAAHAIELEALSEALDQRLAAALGDAHLDDAAYAAAYRESSTREERVRQVALVVAVGRRLDGLVRKPFISHTLKLMRQPARVAGLADLQDFLERGFEAFRDMHGAHEFLETFSRREERILEKLFSGAEDPFSA
jgi:hypothetical protein